MDEKLLKESNASSKSSSSTPQNPTRPKLVDPHRRSPTDSEVIKVRRTQHKRTATDGDASSGSPRSPRSPLDPKDKLLRSDSSKSLVATEEGVTRSPFQRGRADSAKSQYLHSKMSYYRKLEATQRTASPQASKNGLNISAPPPHVLPASLYGIRSKAGHTQSSITTVLSIWNTMIGSTLIALPYGFSESGVILGFGVCIFMGSVSFYTCTLVIKHGLDLPDFNDYVQLFFGRRGSYVGLSFSISILLGVLIAFHILMTENLYQVVKQLLPDSSPHTGDGCHDDGSASLWSEKTAAVAILIIFPLTNLKEVGKLVAMNAYGIYPLAVAISFVLFKGFKCIANADCLHNSHVELAKPTFGKLAGLTSLAFFVHNAIHPILRNGDPKVRNRDTCLAFCAVGICYVIVGAVGYAGFGPCGITQNFLMSYPSSDWFAFCARAAMVMQLATVYPLIAFIIRTQLFGLVLGVAWPGMSKVLALNLFMMGLTTTMAVLGVPVGDVLRYVGSVCGFSLCYFIPIVGHFIALRRKGDGEIGMLTYAFHMGLMAIGFGCVLLQFI